jgi:starch phosphorylase
VSVTNVVVAWTCNDSRSSLEDALVSRLVRLAYNLRWSWEPSAEQLFAQLAPETWAATHNAVAVLRSVSRDDSGGLMQLAPAIDSACLDLERYLEFSPNGPRVAYLSTEFAIAACLPLYAGGLGVLAGDHLKAASDLGLPLVGIGLLYRYGYFCLTIDDSGYQREHYNKIDPMTLPLRPVVRRDRLPLLVDVPFLGRQVYARAWRADVGRVPLYLLDTDIPQNRPDDRWITAHLYGGDHDTRIRQEIVLGIGGARLLRALFFAELEPAVSVYHLNEGHSAFVVLELARERLDQGVANSFDEALLQVAPHVAFTTHTPVTAGHDAFPSDLMDAYLAAYRPALGLDAEQLMRFGRVHPEVAGEPFSMTVLGLRGASRRNGVSQLHARVSRDMWRSVGVGIHDDPPEVPMEAITNGVHGPTWAGPEMGALFDRVLGRSWRVAGRQTASWAPLQTVPPVELWTARTAQRARLLARAGVKLDPERTLVIGFARRFATYKRAGLPLEQPERLARLIAASPDQPVVIMFAGKAHPRDEPGKLLVERIVQASHDQRFRGWLTFLPDYDIDLARLLVQGADVWLNTPRRPHEASGTSGMKATLNGALHLSELDGWWDEAYQPGIGWALGVGLSDNMSDLARDAAEADQLLELLEQHVVPSFHTRSPAGIPLDWLMRVNQSIRVLAPRFSAERMVAEYAERMYAPAHSGVEQEPVPRSQAAFSRQA